MNTEQATQKSRELIAKRETFTVTLSTGHLWWKKAITIWIKKMIDENNKAFNCSL